MQHRNAPLAPIGRRRLVALVEEERLTFEAAAAASNVSKSTAHTWVTRWRDPEDLGDLVGGEQFVAGESELVLHLVLSAVRTPAGPNGQHVDHLLVGATVEDHAPLPHSQAPDALGALEPFDVTVRKLADGGGNPLPVFPTQPAK